MTIDSILQDIQTKIESNEPISAGIYLDYAAKLNLLLLPLEDELIKAEMVVNRSMATLMESGSTAANAKIITKANPEYESLLTLKSRKEHIIELVRIAKKRTELARWDQG